MFKYSHFDEAPIWNENKLITIPLIKNKNDFELEKVTVHCKT